MLFLRGGGKQCVAAMCGMLHYIPEDKPLQQTNTVTKDYTVNCATVSEPFVFCHFFLD